MNLPKRLTSLIAPLCLAMALGAFLATSPAAFAQDPAASAAAACAKVTLGSTVMKALRSRCASMRDKKCCATSVAEMLFLASSVRICAMVKVCNMVCLKGKCGMCTGKRAALMRCALAW